MTSTLDIVGPCSAWHGAAYCGHYVVAGVGNDVFALLGPEGATPETLTKARAAADPARGLLSPGIHRLLGVELHQGRVAWLFPASDAIGLGHTIDSEGRPRLGPRAAAEAVAAVADVLALVGDARNRGPEPTDVLLEASGRIWVSGFAGPFPTSPSMRAPRGDEGEAAAVYRLGALLAWLLTGTAPPAPGERSAQKALVRRTLVRAMAQPGPGLPERYADWIGGMLAWEPDARPPLGTVARGLRTVAATCSGPDLPTWAADNVPAVRASLVESPRIPISRVITLPIGDDPTAPDDARGPLDATPIGAPHRDDDPTQEAQGATIATLVTAVPTRTATSPPASMPIRVGPPPEAIRDVSLPAGFLDQETDERTIDAPTPWLAPVTVGVWAALVALLGVLAVMLGVYVFWPPTPHPDDGPGLHDALPPNP